MMDLPDPGALEQYAKATSATLDVVKKLWHAVSQRKPTGKPTDEQIATLNNALREVLGLMIKAQENEGKAINALFEAVNAHERRHMMALEQRPKQSRRTRVPKKKPRGPKGK